MKTWLRTWVFLASAAAPAMAVAAQPTGPCAVGLQVAPGTALGTTVDFCSELPYLQTTVKLVVAASPSLPAATDPLTPATQAFASHESVDLKTAWTAASNLRFDLSAADQLDQTRNSLTLPTGADHQIDIDQRNASIAVVLTPSPALDLSLTGATAQRSVFDSVVAEAAAPQTQSTFVTSTEDAAVGLNWRVGDRLTVEADGKTETGDVVWRSSGQASTQAGVAYGAFEPSLTAALATPGDGKLSLTFENAVSPIDPGVLSSFAAVEGPSNDARLGPNREWRYRLNLDQTLAGELKVSATLIEASLESSTEMGPVAAGLQAPISIAGGRRSEVDLSVSAPLAALGLPSFTLQGAGSWRSSEVRDPFTGEARPLSGETPQLATIALIQSLPRQKTRWGLEGRFGGDQTIYQMSQVTEVDVAGGLGGFVEYDPGAFVLKLQVDGLYGGGRSYTDIYYSGVRGTGSVDRIDRHGDNGQAIRLTLSKAL